MRRRLPPCSRHFSSTAQRSCRRARQQQQRLWPHRSEEHVERQLRDHGRLRAGLQTGAVVSYTVQVVAAGVQVPCLPLAAPQPLRRHPALQMAAIPPLVTASVAITTPGELSGAALPGYDRARPLVYPDAAWLEYIGQAQPGAFAKCSAGAGRRPAAAGARGNEWELQPGTGGRAGAAKLPAGHGRRRRF